MSDPGKAISCRRLAMGTAGLLALALIAVAGFYGGVGTIPLALFVVLFAIFAGLWIRRCRPSLCNQVLCYLVGAGLAAGVLGVAGLVGVAGALPALAVAAIVVGGLTVVGLARRCFGAWKP